ncbi:MAG: helix-turn-helix domain-containing protein [Pseudohongiellaceae bacterium]
MPKEKPNKQTPGEILRQARLENNLSEKQAADKLHITVHYLRALESNDFDKLPAPVYTKGYMRSYATLLGLDVDAVLSGFDNHPVKQHTEAGASKDLTESRRRHSGLAWMFGLVIILAAILVSYWLFI